jgi:putative flippase GtrA
MALKRKYNNLPPLLKQLIRFGFVGSCAAATNFVLVILAVETCGLKPLTANAFAFLLAFQVSYFGHRRWTFSGTTARHSVAFPKLFLICGLGFFANEGLFYIFLTVFKLQYLAALFLVLTILPIVNFTLGKFWVFR